MDPTKKEARTLLQKAMDLLFGNDAPVTSPDQPVIGDSGLVVRKQLDGQPRWFAWVSNKWEDDQKQIITDSAHREFEAYLDQNPQAAPAFWTWHTPMTARKNRADWWHYADGFFMYSGLFTPEEAAHYDKDVDTDIGMSHGFFVLKHANNKRHILKYRTFEVSELPRDWAANKFTSFLTIKEETKTMFTNPIKRDFLVKRFGEEVVANLEANTEGTKEELERLGVNMKELEAEVAQKEAELFEERVVAATVKATDARTNAIVAEIVKAMNPDGLQATIINMQKTLDEHEALVKQVAVLQELVAHLKETEDTRIASLISPVKPIDWSKSVTAPTNDSPAETLSPDLAQQAKQIHTQQSDNHWLKQMVSLSPTTGV